MLLEARVDTRARDKTGLTALHIVAIHDDPALTRLLLGFGAEVAAQAPGPRGRTVDCFVQAIERRSEAVVQEYEIAV
jgi:ankyrin repeat protein